MHTRPGHRTLWPLLSLLALLALAMPQLAWACSMTGKVALTPETACPCAAAAQSESQEHKTAHGCCDSVPLPADSTAGPGWNMQISLGSMLSVLAHPAPIALPFLASPTIEFQAPVREVVASPFPTISPPLISQHSSLRLQGRAPPF